MKDPSYLTAYEDGKECSETSAYKTQTPGNYPEEIIQHSEHGESLKSKTHTQSSYIKVFSEVCCLMTLSFPNGIYRRRYMD